MLLVVLVVLEVVLEHLVGQVVRQEEDKKHRVEDKRQEEVLLVVQVVRQEEDKHLVVGMLLVEVGLARVDLVVELVKLEEEALKPFVGVLCLV